jgi:hypothetical protein
VAPEADILAYFDLGVSNGPVEARLNGLLKHLRGISLGFKNLNNYISIQDSYSTGSTHCETPRAA